MSKKKGRSKRSTAPKVARSTSSLGDHRRTGKVLQPPLKQIGNLKLTSWLRDALPDWLLVCMHLRADPDDGLAFLCRVLDVANDALDLTQGKPASERPPLDGSLTAWATVAEASRDDVITSLKVAGLYEVLISEPVLSVLRLYDDLPCHWLIEPQLAAVSSGADPAAAELILDETLAVSFHGQAPVPTRAKALALRGLLVAQKISFPSGMDDEIDRLTRYPRHLEGDELAMTESFIRASFVSFPPEDGSDPPETTWAKSFWRANWTLFPCRVADDDIVSNDDDLRAAADELRERVRSLWEPFVEAALHNDPDLYDPDRHEVLTGIVARSLRLLMSASQSPAYWTAEHSAPLTRSLVEALITATWLVKRADDALFTRFKDFGRGHLKLWKLHLEEYADGLDEVPDELREQIDYLTVLVNEEIGEEFQDIDIGGSFAGIDMRKMALECGLEQDYRLVLAPASSDFHGEWGHLARYALVTCMTPAHRSHRIPNVSGPPTFSASGVRVAADFAERLVKAYVAAVTRSATS